MGFVGDMWEGYDEALADQFPREEATMLEDGSCDDCSDDTPGLNDIDTTRLHMYVLQSERWRGYMFAVGYELDQMKKMRVICDDATIKVRRLLHNMEEKMKETEELVWDENHHLKADFSFTGISTSGVREIILLYDWHAINPLGKTYAEMGFPNEEAYIAFRRKCAETARNLRNNQYAKSLAVKRDRIQRRIQELQDAIEEENQLKYRDLYGKDAYSDEGDATSSTSAKSNLKPYAVAYNVLAESESSRAQYKEDASRMVDRTVDYLKHLGLIEDVNDLEGLVTRASTLHYQGDVKGELDRLTSAKEGLDGAMKRMVDHRKSI